MISPRINPCVPVLVLTLLCATAWAGEPNEAPIHLEFEMSPTPLGPFSTAHPPQGDLYMWKPFASHRPAFAAAIPIVAPTDYLPYVNHRTVRSVYGFLDGQEMGVSDRQKAFLEVLTKLFEPPNNRLLLWDRLGPNEPRGLLLYAVTREDAEKMALAYCQQARRDFATEVHRLEQQVQNRAQEIESTEQKIAETEKLIETTQKTFDEFQKTVPYRDESEAHDAIGELDRMLNTAQVEIAGSKAKMQAILKHQRESELRHRSQEVIDRLEMMYMEEAIVLQGTEARRQMATGLREQANRYLDLKATLVNAPLEKKGLGETLHRVQQYRAVLQANLASARQNKPKLPTKVVIYPVQWTDEPTQN